MHSDLPFSIVLVVQCSVFSCFIHFHARPMYHAWLDAKSDGDRQALVDNFPEDTCIEMTSTRWLCLLKPSHRGTHACNVYSALRMYAPAPPSAGPADHHGASGHGSDETDDDCTESQRLPAITSDMAKRKRPRESLDSNYAP